MHVLRHRFIPQLALAFLLLGLLAIRSQAQTFDAPLQLSRTGLWPAMAVDPAGNTDVIWRDSVNYVVWFARSTDGGATFSAPTQILGIPPQTNNAPAPQIVVDASGTIHVLAAGNGNTGSGPFGYELFYARSTDNGSTFSTNAITKGAGSDSSGVLILGPSGSVNILWAGLGATGGPSNLQLSRSKDGGQSFETTIVWNWPSDLNPGFGLLQLALDANENIYVAIDTATKTSPSTCDVYVTRSTDQGKTFYPPVNVSHSSACAVQPQIAVDKSGDVEVLWEDDTVNGPSDIFFSRLAAGTTSFSAPVALEASGTAINPAVAVDRSGDILAIWFVHGGSTFLDAGTYLRRSTDGGATFSSAIKLEVFEFVPPIMIDMKGNIEIAGGGNNKIVLVRSTDGGATFSSPTTIVSGPTSETQSCPEFVQMGLDNAGRIGVIWEEWTKTPGLYACDSLPNFVYFSRGTFPDFTISASPGTESLLPGGAGKFTVTLTASGGFSDAVNLSCTKLPAGAECAFDPSAITPKDSGSQVTLTVTTPPTLAESNYSVTVTAASGSIAHTQDVQVVVGGISGSVTPSSATIAVGSSANFAVSLHSFGGFSGPVNLACGGAPSGISCSFAPAQVSVAANGSASSTLTVHVAAKPSVSQLLRMPNLPAPFSRNLPWMPVNLACFAALLLLLTFRMTRLWTRPAAAFASLALVLVLAVGLVSCGGATKSSTPSGTATSGTGSSGATGGTGGTGGGSSITAQFAVQAQSGGATVNLGTVSVTVP